MGHIFSENIFGENSKKIRGLRIRGGGVEEERERIEKDRGGKIKLRYFIYMRFKLLMFDLSLHIYR